MKRSRRTIFRRIFKPTWLYLLSRSLKPLSHNYGANRGQPVDRYYIEKFLRENRKFITGRCLEVETDIYCSMFGCEAKCNILDISKDNKKAAVIADLRNMPEIKNETYNCIILTQVFQFVDDHQSAVKECYRILKPEGVLLATFPFLSRVDCRAGCKGDFWRFTDASAKYIFSKYFPPENLEIKSWGNVFGGLAFWIGAVQEELSKKELEYTDPDFPVIISVRAIK